VSISGSEINVLRNNVLELLATSRLQLRGGMVDLSPVEVSIRTYCEAIAALPLETARQYAPDLQAITEKMNALEHELKQARDTVQQKLSELGQHHKAHVAYKKSDGIGEKRVAPDDAEDTL
jgi:hypothetical protein